MPHPIPSSRPLSTESYWADKQVSTKQNGTMITPHALSSLTLHIGKSDPMPSQYSLMTLASVQPPENACQT